MISLSNKCVCRFWQIMLPICITTHPAFQISGSINPKKSIQNPKKAVFWFTLRWKVALFFFIFLPLIRICFAYLLKSVHFLKEDSCANLDSFKIVVLFVLKRATIPSTYTKQIRISGRNIKKNNATFQRKVNQKMTFFGF